MYLREKEKYEQEFKKLYKDNDTIKRLKGVSGIGVTLAIITYAMMKNGTNYIPYAWRKKMAV